MTFLEGVVDWEVRKWNCYAKENGEGGGGEGRGGVGSGATNPLS